MHATIPIILLSNNPTSRGVMRNFDKVGFELILFDKNRWPYSKNKIVVRYIPLSIEHEDKEVLSFLLKIGSQLHDKGFIIPTSDAEISFLLLHRDSLSNYFIFSLAKPDVVGIVQDKFKLYEEMRKQRFHVPQSVVVDLNNHGYLSCDPGFYPCIVKPVFSEDWKTRKASEVIGCKKALLVNDSHELQRCLGTAALLSNRVLVQEIIPAGESGTYSFCSFSDSDGNVLWGFVSQKIIQYPENLGTALFCRTIRDPEISEVGRNIIRALRLDGVCEVEFIRSVKDSRLYIIEINPRHWMQHRLSNRLGVNMSLLDYYYRQGRADNVRSLLSYSSDYAKDAVWIDLKGYVRHCLKNFLYVDRCKFNLIFGKSVEFA